MSLIDFILLVIFGLSCYFVGRVSMVHSLFNTNIENIDTQDPAIGDLFVEKINDTYYAYVGQKFVGQSINLDDLFHNMKEIHKIVTFHVNTIDGLSQAENNLVIQSIEKWYNVI